MDYKKFKNGVDHLEKEDKKYNTKTTRKAIVVTAIVVFVAALAVKLFL